MNARIACAAILGLVGAFGVSGAAAQDDMTPRVSATVSSETVAVGEPLDLDITVLVPTWFPQPPVYPSFELPNAIVRRPPDSSYPTSQRIGRETWSGIVRRYRIYPLIGADFVLADRQMKVTIADPGNDPIIAMADIPDVRFRATVPEGAESLAPYLSGTRLELSLEIVGDAEGLAAGDALVVEYSAELDGLPAMFLPPLAPEFDMPGASVYRDEPEITDESTARRSERLTLVFEAGGEFVLPGVGIDYWNTDSSTIERVEADGFSFVVEGPPLPPPQAEKEATNWRSWGVAGLLVLAGALLLHRALPPLLARRRRAQERWLKSEAFAFRQAEQALESGDAKGAYLALIHWLERLDPGQDLRSFSATYGDADLAGRLDALAASLYDGAAADRPMERLRGDLSAARARYMSEQKQSVSQALPPLNPTA